MSFECRHCEKKGVPASIGCVIPEGLVKLFACSKCLETLYCSKECQQNNWKGTLLIGHKVVCTKWRKEQEETKARGERTMFERSVAVVKAGFKHTLSGFRNVRQRERMTLIEGENHLNMLVGIVYEPEDQVKDEMFAGVCLHVDGGLCCITLNSKTTTVRIVRKASTGKEEVLPRYQMRKLSSGDKLLVHFPTPNNPLLMGSQKDFIMEYKRYKWGERGMPID